MINTKLPHILSDDEMDEIYNSNPEAAKRFVHSGEAVMLLPGFPPRFAILSQKGKTLETGLNIREVKDRYDRG